MGLFEEFKRAYAGDDTRHYSVGGKQVTCSHCGGQDFDLGRAMLNTRGFTFFGLDWANRGANLLICKRCGEVRWFVAEPQRL